MMCNTSHVLYLKLVKHYVTTYKFLLIIHIPTAIRRQNPILGRNKTLSAITKPTVKNKFDEGIKENVAMATHSDKIFETGS